MAILEDNPKGERTIGYSDVDMIEIYEQSMEVIALNEELNKKATFNQVVKWMMEKAKEGTPAGKQAGGDSCCGGGPAPKTPDSVIATYLPKLTEVIIQILSEAPFHGVGYLPVKGATGFKFKGEMLMTTILNFTLRVLGTKLQQKRKITMDKPANADNIKSGDKFDITVRLQKYAFLKTNDGSDSRRIWVALVSLFDSSVQLQEADPKELDDSKKFSVTASAEGEQSFRAYVISGDGHIEKTVTDLAIKIK